MPNSTLKTCEDLYVLQSRYAQNGFQGNSRWVIVNPSDMALHGALGKDGYPPVFNVLAKASADGGQVYGSGSSSDNEQPNEAALKRLVETGLLKGGDDPQQDANMSFFQRYHKFVRDYPFNDYGRPNRWNKDREQMAEYGKVELPPSQYTCFDNPPDVTAPLPVPLYRRQTDGSQSPINDPLAVLATTLAGTLQSTGSINGGDFGPWLRKACPSGGARHPTEVRVELHNIPGVQDGNWLYDADHHRLADYRPLTRKVSSSKSAILLHFVSRVERPMWRYREPRSLRPVIIDGGHVIENVAIYLKHFGYQLKSASTATNCQFDFTAPALASFWVSGGRLEVPRITENTIAENQIETVDTFGVNPFLWLSFQDGQLCANTSFNNPQKGCLDQTDFRILNYCVASKRGDRPNDKESICRALDLSSSEKIEQLFEKGFLISAQERQEIDKQISKWCKFGWYQSLLAYLDVHKAEPHYRVEDVSDINGMGRDPEHFRWVTSTKRKTTRAFRDTNLSEEDFSSLLAVVKSTTAVQEGDVFAKVCRFYGADGHLQTVTGNGATSSMPSTTVKREEVLKNCIGQFPLKTANCVLWLCTEAQPKQPGLYASRLLDLGRIGQRLCLHCAEHDIGVFLSPAVRDSETHSMLQIEDKGDFIFYMFAFGYPQRKTVEDGASLHRYFEKNLQNDELFLSDINAPDKGIIITPNGLVSPASLPNRAN